MQSKALTPPGLSKREATRLIGELKPAEAAA